MPLADLPNYFNFVCFFIFNTMFKPCVSLGLAISASFGFFHYRNLYIEDYCDDLF